METLLEETLLERYNRPAPRYTSYPPIPHWTGDVGAPQLRTAIEASTRPLSIYVHIPFCEQLCLYCGCNVVVTHDHGRAGAYLEQLASEMDRLEVAHGRQVTQVHYGGGSPTFLTPDELHRLFDAIEQRFRIASGAELAVEIDPRRTSREHLEALASRGFNRLSIGVQDFNPEVQRAIRRVQPFEMTRRTVIDARRMGFDGINVDLIYGLPFQTVETIGQTIDRVLSLEPDRVALFSYAHVPALKRHQRVLTDSLPGEAEKLALFQAAIHRFGRAGYTFIGIDHFARADDPLSRAHREGTLGRNFQGYTTYGGADLVGFGASAISCVGDVYTQNLRDLPGYQEALADGKLPVFRGWIRNRDDRIRGAVIESLLSNAVVVKDAIRALFEIDFDSYFAAELDALAEFEKDGLVERTPESIRITATGRFFARVVSQVFDAYQQEGVAARAV